MKNSFIGFLPKTQTKITEEIALKYKHNDFIFYESPKPCYTDFRKSFKKSALIQNALSDANFTKVFEEIVVDKTENIISHLKIILQKVNLSA